MTLDEVLHVYGDPHTPDFESRWLVRFDLPYPMTFGAGDNAAMLTHARCHKLAVAKFVTALTVIRDNGLVDEASEFNGIFAVRGVRGFPRIPSAHSWGLALDLNASRNPLGGPVRQHIGVLKAFVDAGFYWGGAFRSRVDGMHFSLVGW